MYSHLNTTLQAVVVTYRLTVVQQYILKLNLVPGRTAMECLKKKVVFETNSHQSAGSLRWEGRAVELDDHQHHSEKSSLCPSHQIAY